MNGKIITVIPVRAGSQRLKNKNILPFGGSNLLIHKIRQLKQVGHIDEIVVSSDSEAMLQMALDEGVLANKRAAEYCDEKTKTFNEVVENVAQNIDCEYLMWAPCVCPLTQPETYQKALDLFKEKVIRDKEFDSVISAKLFKEYLFDETKPLNWDSKKHVPSQQLPDWKTIVNGFYIAPKAEILKWKYLYGEKPYLYILNKKEAVDIDDEEDFEVAKALLGLTQ